MISLSTIQPASSTSARYSTNLGWSKYTYCPLPCFLRVDTPTMVVDDTHARVIRLSGLLLLFIMLSKYGENGSECEFRNARSAFLKFEKLPLCLAYLLWWGCTKEKSKKAKRLRGQGCHLWWRIDPNNPLPHLKGRGRWIFTFYQV